MDTPTPPRVDCGTTHTSTEARPAALIHPTVDAIIIEATLTCLADMLAGGIPLEEAAAESAQFMAEQVSAWPSYTDPDYDPTDAELERSWNAPDAPAAHKAAWQLHQELHDRSAS